MLQPTDICTYMMIYEKNYKYILLLKIYVTEILDLYLTIIGICDDIVFSVLSFI